MIVLTNRPLRYIESDRSAECQERTEEQPEASELIVAHPYHTKSCIGGLVRSRGPSIF